MILKKIKTEPKTVSPSDPIDQHFPSFYVSSDEMPEVADWKVGDKYLLTIKARMRSKNTTEDKDHSQVNASMDIIAYKEHKEKPIEDMTDKEFGNHVGKVMASKPSSALKRDMTYTERTLKPTKRQF